MANSNFPSALLMRDLKYGASTEAQKDDMAARLRAAGRRAEALLLFEGRGDHPFVAEERDWAVSEGDAFHLLSVRRMGGPVEDSHLEACARQAEQRGRWMDARNCWVVLDDEAALVRIADHLPPSLKPGGQAGAPDEEASDEGA